MVIETSLRDLFEGQIGRENRAIECASSVRGLLPTAAASPRDILELLVRIYDLDAMFILFCRWLLISTSEVAVDRHDRRSSRVSVVCLGPRRRRQGRSHDYRERWRMPIHTKQ